MKMLIRGLALVNLLYLIMFYVLYFPLVYTAGYLTTTINGLAIFAPFVAAVPASTTAVMNFLLYVVVPLAALAWTLMANQQPTYQQVP